MMARCDDLPLRVFTVGNKKPLRWTPEGRKSGETFQNPRGGPMTADTTTAERLVEPIAALIVVTERFMTMRTRIEAAVVVHPKQGVRLELADTVPVCVRERLTAEAEGSRAFRPCGGGEKCRGRCDCMGGRSDIS